MRLVAALVALSACTVVEDARQASPLDDRAGMPPDRYIYVAVRDGDGWLVQRVDDGMPEHVTAIDLVGTGLDEEAQNELLAVAASNPDMSRATVAFRGMLVESTDAAYHDLRATGAWRGPAPEDDYRHDGAWFTFIDDYPEAVSREVGNSTEYAVHVEPAAPSGVRDRDTLVVGQRDGNRLAVAYRLIRVRP
jgi:hypothetical protein